MRIGIDASPIVGDRGGVGWHTSHLLRAMVDLKEDIEFIAYVLNGSLKNGTLDGWESSPRLRWMEAGRVTMPWRGTWDRLDLYHGTNFKLRTTGRFGGVVTIHDLWLDRYPQYSTKLFGQRVSFLRTKRTAWRAKKVITVSDYSARDITSLYGLPPDRVAVIPNGVSQEFCLSHDPDAWRTLSQRLRLPTDRFILFVGGADPRKNHRVLLHAYQRRKAELKDYSLVLVGDIVHRFDDMRNTIRSCGLEGRVVCTGRLPMTDIGVLYSYADLFVFPSLYEGFGMPVLEAMACGAPVITSNRTSLPEVAGDAAILVDPENAEAVAEAMVLVLGNPSAREELRAKGLARARQFTWERAARQTVAVYREICNSDAVNR